MQTNAEELSDDDKLYHRIEPDAVDDDGTLNSLCFHFRFKEEDGVSADLVRETTPEKALEPMPSLGLVEVRVGDLRALGLTVERDPLPDNPAHVLIKGNFSKSTRRKIAKVTNLLVPPTAPQTDI